MHPEPARRAPGRFRSSHDDDAEVLTSPLDRARLLLHVSRIVAGRRRPAGPAVVTVPGRDPLRLLVVGAGLVAGFGEADHGRALPGALARALAGATGRGVEVEVRVGRVLPSRGAADRVGRWSGEWDAVVFAPCFVETAMTGATGIARHAVAVAERLLAATTRGTGRVVLLHLPCPTRFSRADLVAVQAVARVNRSFQAVRHERLVRVEPPEIGSWSDPRSFDRRYYADLAGRVSAAVLQPIGA